MKIILIILVSFWCCTITYQANAGPGLGEWSRITPGNNEINNIYGQVNLYLKAGKELNNLSKWYFYHGYIIGLYNSGKYFAVDEETSSIYIFRSQADWIAFLFRENLEPKIWTRWFETDWNGFLDLIWLYGILFIYITIPLVILYFWLCYKAIVMEKFSIRRPNTIIVTLVGLFILVTYFFARFPQSI